MTTATETLATAAPATNDSTAAPAEPQPTQQPVADANTTPVVEQTDEQKAAAEAAAKAEANKATAVKAEEDRRAALTPEQRKAEDDAKAQAEERRKANFGAPEKYEFKPADGKPPVDATVIGELEAVAKELDLSPAAAQRMYDLGQKVVDKHVETINQQITATRADWLTQSKADKEFGGDQVDANLAVARKAMELGTPELKQLLNDTGLGDHPEVIRWMFRVGKTLKQDEHVSGTRSTPGRTAQSYYPNSNMNP